MWTWGSSGEVVEDRVVDELMDDSEVGFCVGGKRLRSGDGCEMEKYWSAGVRRIRREISPCTSHHPIHLLIHPHIPLPPNRNLPRKN